MGLMVINVCTAADSGKPKLVVGIVVDQLRTDYIEHLRSLFGEKGFNRLIKDGVYLRDVDFKALVNDPATATAILYTGNYPAANGIPAAAIYDPATRKINLPLFDPSALGNSTNQTLSPIGLRLSTISDQIAVDGGGVAMIYSVGADPQQAIVMAGHAGNGALWLNTDNGNWCSTTYYRDFPQTISHRNRTKPLSSRIDTVRWQPLLPLSRYSGLSSRKYPFSYTFPRADKNVYSQFALSAPGNVEVTDVAIECLTSQRLGIRSEATDMLNVAYSAAPYKATEEADYTLELQDTYLRLDGQLQRLFEAIDKQVGLDNAVIFLSGTGYFDDAAPVDAQYRIPGGEISLKRVESLLNSFLSAKYGNGDFIDAIHNNAIYLNDAEIDRKGLNRDQLREEAREFIVKMSGISGAKTLGQLLSDTSAESEALRLAADPKLAGDIFLTFNPGWKVIDDRTYPATTYTVGASAINTPVFILAPALPATTISTPVEAVEIAPTITSALHIRSPNGVIARPILF